MQKIRKVRYYLRFDIGVKKTRLNICDAVLVISMEFIDISNWQKDDEFYPYPEGSRDKYALISPLSCDDPRVVPDHRYLMKFSNPRYPIQFWSEVIAEIIGRHAQVEVPPVFIAKDPETGQPGSLIQWFYGSAVEGACFDGGAAVTDADVLENNIPIPLPPDTYSVYVPGSSYMARHIENYDLKTGRQHNLRTVHSFVKALGISCAEDFWPKWGAMLTFDALIGNTDRHQDNWGVLWRRDSEGRRCPRFAPAFDNGTSLFHEILEDRLARFDDLTVLVRYVRKGYHHMKLAKEDKRQAQHFSLVRQLVELEPSCLASIKRTLSFDLASVREEVTILSGLEIEPSLSPKRVELILRALELRQEILYREIFKNA
jgi:hypothetical protein